jgi:hypothetical protein
MLEKVQKVQSEMERMKAEIAQKTVVAESGGGLVQVTMTGSNEVVAIKISKEIVDPNDIEMLEDLVVAAVNKASKAAGEMASEHMKSITGMLPNVPGINFNI